MNELRPHEAKVFNTAVNAEANMLTKPSWNANFNEGTDNKNTETFDWWWCDALYMGLNTYTLMYKQTGDEAYIQKGYKSYLYWKEKLYNPAWKLWHRDLDNKNDKNPGSGLPEFWARGNAWVIAALAKQLLNIDENEFPEMYQTYKNDLIDIAATLKEHQRGDGTWNTSIIDPGYFAGTETTGTSGFMYGIIIGIQLGILDYNEYFPVVSAAYDALTGMCMLEPFGRIGYMQDVGYQPENYVSTAYTQPRSNAFGYGLFLIGASALMRMCKDYSAPALRVPNDPQSSLVKI
jgi:rhamnogalacturonyl hydrolase YesR